MLTANKNHINAGYYCKVEYNTHLVWNDYFR